MPRLLKFGDLFIYKQSLKTKLNVMSASCHAEGFLYIIESFPLLLIGMEYVGQTYCLFVLIWSH